MDLDRTEQSVQDTKASIFAEFNKAPLDTRIKMYRVMAWVASDLGWWKRDYFYVDGHKYSIKACHGSETIMP